ncbi:MAG: hypothetical protein XXXJIFNMEKO3_00357 [Candidatus Erwinia impunctatus]|nr:hypothetical protein XXXJIFNMEKO_00357 [Culicoides impunctatus]
MLMVISPAKTLDYTSPLATHRYSQPDLLDNSQKLINIAKALTPAQIASLMHTSDKLAHLNTDRFNEWHQPFTPENARQAILAFKGDVYTGLAADSFSEDDFEFAQHHLRMLSGLYGVLRPLDLIQPYRLEMGIKLANDAGNSLYAFWGSQLTETVNQTLKKAGSDLLINLASDEYFKAIQPEKLQAQVIKPVFLDEKNGKYKVISFYAKKARGLMCRFIIQRQLSRPEQLESFAEEGYRFVAEESNDQELIFKRAEGAV